MRVTHEGGTGSRIGRVITQFLDVSSYVVLERIYREAFGPSCPDFADVFIGRQAFESFKTLGEVVGLEDRMQMRFQMIV